MECAIWVQAIGTLVLVIVTWRYVRLTRQLSNAASKQLEELKNTEKERKQKIIADLHRDLNEAKRVLDNSKVKDLLLLPCYSWTGASYLIHGRIPWEQWQLLNRVFTNIESYNKFADAGRNSLGDQKIANIKVPNRLQVLKTNLKKDLPEALEIANAQCEKLGLPPHDLAQSNENHT